MATVAYAANTQSPLDHAIFTWTPLTTTNADGQPVGYPGRDRSIQVTGTFGAGGSVTLQGSNDGGANWFALNDWSGAPITFTSAGLKTVRDDAALMRPFVTAGDGTTSITATMAARKIVRNY